MLKRLGRVAREAREAAELDQIDIATTAGISHGVVSNFERGVRWPRIGADVLIEAYEAECGLNADELWRRAIATPA